MVDGAAGWYPQPYFDSWLGEEESRRVPAHATPGDEVCGATTYPFELVADAEG
jgi:hypothetical protein